MLNMSSEASELHSEALNVSSEASEALELHSEASNVSSEASELHS